MIIQACFPKQGYKELMISKIDIWFILNTIAANEFRGEAK
ncbi:protein of unknown function [Oenococcus oeni]|nr:hypothetical protein OENI_40099 [Oenococcus oeni]SYW18285.1 hypothetical protein OENI_30099 [Oenococcus oeni]VDC14223.1 protein of unknown function [Oenococcus oeni]